MSQDFLRQPGRPGVFGALLDESARAAEDFCRVVQTYDAARFEGERASDDTNTVSPLAICRHVCVAAQRYAHYIRKARGMDFVERFELDPARLETPDDVRARLREALQLTEATVEGLHGASEEALHALAFTVRWGPRYDPEMILEHGIVHLLRHRRQLERW